MNTDSERVVNHEIVITPIDPLKKYIVTVRAIDGTTLSKTDTDFLASRLAQWIHDNKETFLVIGDAMLILEKDES